MKSLKSTLLVGLAVLFFASSSAQKNNTKKTMHEATWSSLRKHQTPGWFDGMRFGIYTHWGLSTVQNLPGNHDLGKEELIPLFDAPKFNATRWAKLFKDAGAQFAGPVGWHGDLMSWDSDISPDNMKDQLGLDFAGEMEKAIRDEGMKFILSLHSGWGSNWLPLGKEVIQKLNPDILWVDTGFGGTKGAAFWKTCYAEGKMRGPDNRIGGLDEKSEQEFIAYYFNHAQKHDQEVQFVYKQYDIPFGIGTRNLENGLFENSQYDFWMTDINMIIHEEKHNGVIPKTWFYHYDQKMKSANYLVDMLVDVSSKNGCLFLNVPPMADGSFSEGVENNLLEIGQWLKINGEAIYDAVPWCIYGEGPTEMTKYPHPLVAGPREGHHSDHTGSNNFNEADFRFLSGDNNLYAICMDVPTSPEVKILALGSAGKLGSNIKAIEILGYKGEVQWEQSADALTISMPENTNLKYAVTFKLLRK
jgi:alpha-L-fucosidase